MAGQIYSRFLQYGIDAKVIYVDAAAGSDTAESGRGGVLQPYATISAAVAGLTSGNYILQLGEGSYAAPASWPTASGLNISVQGQGRNLTTITGAIAYTSVAQADAVIFSDVAFSGTVTLNLALSTAGAYVRFEESSVGIVRSDSNFSAALQCVDSVITSFSTSGAMLLQDCFVFGTNTISSGGFAVSRGGQIPTGSVAISSGGTLIMAATTCFATITGAGTLTSDASSLANASIGGFTGTLSLSDSATYEAYTPATPGDYPVGTDTVKKALDALTSLDFSASAHGYVPAPVTVTGTKYLRDDGTWATVAGSSIQAREVGVLPASPTGITLANTPVAASVNVVIQGAGPLIEGVSYDYTISGAVITFSGALQTALAAGGDVYQVTYEY